LTRILAVVEPPFPGDVRRPRALGERARIEEEGGTGCRQETSRA